MASEIPLITTLEEGLNPIGLRIQIFPTLHNFGSILEKKYEENLQSCLTMIFALLMNEYKEQSVTIDREIGKLYTEPAKNIDKNKLKDFREKWQITWFTFNQEIINKKGTFRKDKVYFDNNRAYKWPSPDWPWWRSRKTPTWNEEGMYDLSDNSSQKSYSSTSH